MVMMMIFFLADSATGSTSHVETDHVRSPSSETDAAGKRTSRLRRPVLWSAVLLCGLMLPAAVYLFPKLKSNQAGATQQDAPVLVATPRIRLTESDGFPIPLFRGTEVDPTQKSSGSWEPAEGGEGEPVLSGQNGFRDFRCRDGSKKPLGFYRFVCGFRHNESDLIEFNFKVRDDDPEPLFNVAIKPDMATLASGNIIKQCECELQQFDDAQNFGYHQFRIESQPGYWRIEVDRELLGEIDKPADFNGDDSLIQLLVEGNGSAHFEGISFIELTGEPSER